MTTQKPKPLSKLKFIKRMLITIILIYLTFAIIIYSQVEKLIFLPPPSTYEDTEEIIKLISEDGTKLSAIHLSNPDAKYTILYAHGNGSDLGMIKPRLEQLKDIGFSVLGYDYRGYGTSEGKPSEKNAYKDIDTAYNYLTQELKILPQKIIPFGRSVGGGSAIDLAARKPVAGLITESTFTSIFKVKVPIKILPFDKFPNLEKIKRVKCPVLIMHGKLDEVVPFYHSEQLFEQTPSPKLSLWIEDAKHNNFPYAAGERYTKILKEFIELVNNYNSISYSPLLNKERGWG
ncbi:Putative lysophospholipase [Rivularia sp. PCC 7116]|nr:Putative lysophospholipase [Rivularia sp. PCC 7116]